MQKIYLDNAATTQKPACVIEAEADYYRTMTANVHRAAHTLAERATDALERARADVARFIGAARSEEIVFTKGCTESINLLAASLGQRLVEGDEVLITFFYTFI